MRIPHAPGARPGDSTTQMCRGWRVTLWLSAVHGLALVPMTAQGVTLPLHKQLFFPEPLSCDGGYRVRVAKLLPCILDGRVVR